MKSFFTIFGKGILYFLAMPFMLVFLVLFGIYMLIVFFITLTKTIILFFQGKPTGIKDELDEKALFILRERKKEALTNSVKQMQPITQNTINQTNNYYNLNATPQNLQTKEAPLIAQEPIDSNDIQPINSELRKVDPINENNDTSLNKEEHKW